MKIAVPSLSPGKHEFRCSVPPTDYGWPVALSRLDFRGRVDVEAVVDKMGDELFVRADVRADARTECARCLEPCDLSLAAHFEALYVPEAQRDVLGSRTDRAEEESQRIVYYSSGVVDLGEQIIEAISLAVPMKPLCRDGCKGLCPHCGANLNEGRCSCADDGDFGKPFKELFGDSG